MTWQLIFSNLFYKLEDCLWFSPVDMMQPLLYFLLHMCLEGFFCTQYFDSLKNTFPNSLSINSSCTSSPIFWEVKNLPFQSLCSTLCISSVRECLNPVISLFYFPILYHFVMPDALVAKERWIMIPVIIRYLEENILFEKLYHRFYSQIYG